MGVLRKFGLLLWKNWLYRKRSKVSTIFAIIMTTLLSLLLLIMVNITDTDYGTYQKDFTRSDEKQIDWKDYSDNSDHSNYVDEWYEYSDYDDEYDDDEERNLMKENALDGSDGSNKITNFCDSVDDDNFGEESNLATKTDWVEYSDYSGDANDKDDVYDNEDENDYNTDGELNSVMKIVYYTPDSNISRDLLLYVMKANFQIFNHSVDFRAVTDENSLTSMGPPDSANVAAAISFVGLGNSLPLKLHYRIRVVKEKQLIEWNYADFLLAPNSGNEPLIDADYDERFILLQHLIAIRFIEMLSGVRTLREAKHIQFSTRQFPYPPHYKETQIAKFMRLFLPLFIIISFIFIFPNLIKNIVREKETGVKELMKLMGYSTWLQWSAWFVSTFIMAMIAAIIMTILLACRWFGIRTVLPKTAPELFLLILLLYIASSISFCFFFSTFFSKPSIAISCAVIIMILTFFIPYMVFNYDKLSFTTKILLLLLPNVALTWILRFIIDIEVQAIGLQWNNLSTPSTHGDKLTALIILGMFIYDIFLYWTLAWYLDQVLPSAYGIRKPWYFLLTKNYWSLGEVTSRDDFDEENFATPEDFEEEPSGLNPLIEIVHLTKRFGWGENAFLAVNNVTFNMYQEQITALLGRNGAGKTTLMSMLTGIIPPTSGTAYINGYDIRSQMDTARESLGLCPQHNMLFNNLTCREHLKFFGGLKIDSNDELNDEIDSFLYKLQLWEKRDVYARKLSGGMKRKLNLGIALIGRPMVVILDEPTSGLDPEARRAIWDVIQEHREGSCILLSTHHMDEVDALADRIAIMSDGQLVSYGSPIFLKNRFGVGYHLHIVKTENTNMNEIADLVDRHIRGAYITSNTNKEILFVLPADQTKYFDALFRDLKCNMNRYGVADYGLSVSSIEDVFLKVSKVPPADLSRRSMISREFPDKNTGITLKLQQIIGLLLKRWYYAKRRWTILIFQFFLPALIIFLGLQLGKLSPSQSKTESSRVMDIAYYGKALMFLNEDSGLKPLPSKSIVIIQTKPEKYLQHLALRDYRSYAEDVIVGAEITNTSKLQMTAWYNGLYYHAEPISLNILHNALLKYYTKNKDAALIVENVPYPRKDTKSDVTDNLFQILMIGIYFPLGISFLSSSFVIFPIHERATMSKQLQMMTGVGGILFWGVSFIWDFLIHTISSCILLLIIILFDSNKIFTGDGKTGLILLLLLLYGWSSIPFAYVMSLTTKSPATGFTRLLLFNVLFGMVLSIVLFIASIMDVKKSSKRLNLAVLVSRLLPTFTVTFALMKIAYIGLMKPTVCSNGDKNKDDCSDLKYFKWDFPGILGDILALILTGVLFFTILALYEFRLLQRILDIFGIRSLSPEDDVDVDDDDILDSDVAQEKARVYDILSQGAEDREVLLVTDLTKNFGDLIAVRGLNFAVASEECFGLLGINGAGKTTTFQMLTGNLIVTKGNAFIFGTSVKSNRSKYLKNVGYCPQVDPLIDYLSGREMLVVFAHLRGIPISEVTETVDDYIDDFDLQDYARKITRVYSGGNKRKLSVALAFIGDPSVVFLDEPTTGVDPISRRKIRDVVGGANRSGMCVVLTSHSMEECEALCDRIGIMVKGQFRALGGIQYLKNKFGEGYVIFARMKRLINESKEDTHERQRNLQRFIELHFPSAKLTDVHEGLVQYQVYDKNTRWAYMFNTMENAKFHFNLEDYTVSQTSLDQVFLSFARK